MAGNARVIINADDFGHDADSAAATIALFERGMLTSATIMANMPATREAIAFARTSPGFSFGVHLTFARDSVEAPLADPARIPTLVDRSDAFRAINRVRVGALLGAIPIDQIEVEMTAQMAFFADSGVRVSHVDSHHHLHKLAPFREAAKRVLPRFGVTKVRTVQDVYSGSSFYRPTAWFGRHWAGDLRRHFASTDHFFMMRGTASCNWGGHLGRILKSSDSLEFGCHPGSEEQWRLREAQQAERFIEFCRGENARLINWWNL